MSVGSVDLAPQLSIPKKYRKKKGKITKMLKKRKVKGPPDRRPGRQPAKSIIGCNQESIAGNQAGGASQTWCQVFLALNAHKKVGEKLKVQEKCPGFPKNAWIMSLCSLARKTA